MKLLIVASAMLFLFQGAGQDVHLVTPPSQTSEHAKLHQQLEKAVAAKGKTGTAAKKVAELLHMHFEKEEAYAMPPLSLLQKVANNEATTDEMKAALKLANRLRQNYRAMLADHKQIVSALRALEKAATDERKPAHAAFARELRQHAQMEEEILYPAALILGDYLRLKLRDGNER